MKFRNLLIATITLLSIGLISSCSKEDRIEKNLWNKGGEWNIESLIVNQTSTNPIDNYSETLINAGTFLFKEDGSGFATFTEDGFTETIAFAYSNTEDKLTLISDNEAVNYNLSWKKNEVELTLKENFISDGESIIYDAKYNLVKK